MLSAKLKSLYDLCKAGTEYRWTDKHEQLFQASKKWLISSDILMLYNPKLPIFVMCDSNGYGVGAVLSHKVNGEFRPVLFASSTLSKVEQRYSNLEREGLALVFALKKFHKCLYGRKFILITDHRPLQFIFGRNKGIPISAAARIIRWALMLSAYDYEIQYKQGKLIANADGLSRLPMPGRTDIPESLYSFNSVDNIPLNADNVVGATKKDVILAKVVDLTITG